MNEMELRQRIRELEKEIEATWDTSHKRMLEIESRVDRLEREITSLKKLFSEEIPEFHARFAKVFEETLEEISLD